MSFLVPLATNKLVLIIEHALPQNVGLEKRRNANLSTALLLVNQQMDSFILRAILDLIRNVSQDATKATI